MRMRTRQAWKWKVRGPEAVCGAGRDCELSLLGKLTATERRLLPPSPSSSVAWCQALTEQAAGDSSEGQMQSWLRGWVIPLSQGRGEVRNDAEFEINPDDASR